MPDIAMCKNKKCPLKETCYRFKANPDRHQSYADFNVENGKCSHYWELKPATNE